MKINSTWILSFLLLFSGLAAHGQYDPKKVCRIEEGRLVFTLDQRWTQSQRREVARMYDLDSLVMAGAFALWPVIRENHDTWTTRKLDANRFELSKEPVKKGPGIERPGKIFLLDDDLVDMKTNLERESVPFGVNRFTRNTVQQISPGKVRFYLPGHLKARAVFLSGSFNGWATLKTPMKPCDSGWMVTLNMLPGKYTYKYIIDGKWVGDSYNKLGEDDTYHGVNNVFFCYNYKFVLNGFNKARKVIITGSFNNWNKTELRMVPFRGSWLLSMYLREGTHAYKFIVDNQWILDPANKVTRPDGKGNRNSFLSIGDTMYFRLNGFQDAGKIAVAGNFNGWNPAELFMEKSAGGWQLPYVLAAGNYEYKFVADGKWMTDPANPFKTGEGEQANSVLVVKPNHLFKLERHSDAKKVSLSGSFNGWSKPGYHMVLQDGVWSLPVSLKPGKYTYKFLVDSKWIIDPGNELWEDNEYGTGNSVLWIEP